jgi:hypothetical protein
LKKKNCLTLFSEFSHFKPKTHFRAGRDENKEKRLFYTGLRMLLSIQNQWLDTGIENPENPKIDSSHFTTIGCHTG